MILPLTDIIYPRKNQDSGEVNDTAFCRVKGGRR